MGRSPSDLRRAANATVVCALGLAGLAPSLAGCSFLFSEGAPDDAKRRAAFTCGDSYAPPVLDAIAAGLSTALAIGAASSEDADVLKVDPVDQPQRRRDINAGIALSVVLAAVDTASAVYGFHATGTCLEAKDERAATFARARTLPYPYGVAPVGEPPPYWPPPPPPPPPAPPTPSP